jgi:drug/metabolite transporter (DMT)-like permease
MCVIWGIPYLFIRVAVRDMAPGTVVFLRAAIGGLVLAPVAFRRTGVGRVFRRWKPLVLFMIIEMAVPWFFLTDAERRISSSLSGLLVAAVPLVGVVIARLTRAAEQPTLRQVCGVFVGLAGVVSLVGLDVGEVSVVPLLEVLVVVIGYALGPVILSRSLSDLPVAPVMFASLVLLSLTYLPYALVRPPTDVRLSAWGSVVVLGVACTALAFLLFGMLIAGIGPARATVITYVNPAVAVGAGVLFLGERFTTGMAVGFPLILLGSVFAARRRSSAPPVQSTMTVPAAVANVAETMPVSSGSSTQVSSIPSSG